MKTDVLIVGAGLGGCAAALAACERGHRVVMTEETDWIGGQVSTQGVPPDEHPWIEHFGATKRYRDFRETIREWYQEKFKVTSFTKPFNPGNGLVSAVCHDPRVSLTVLRDQLLPFQLTGQLVLLLKTNVSKVTREENQLSQAVVQSESGSELSINFSYLIDASETGEVMPLAEIPYVIGAEAREDTGELHAREIADPQDIQAFTMVLAMEYREGENHVIEEPEMYRFWRDYQPTFWPEKYLSFTAPHPHTREPRAYSLFDAELGFPLWTYRQAFDADQFELQVKAGNVTMMNWPNNDYLLGNCYEVSDEEKAKHIWQAKQLSLSLFYWLQTEAPRADGGKGYPGLKLRPDVFETEDGLAKSPYIRESRRLIARYRITEQDLSPTFQSKRAGERYRDSVGVGSYSIDLHPSIAQQNYLDIPALPYHIPLGALLTEAADNFIAGSKNIGTTHITNGCYRLHPTEWNIGEVAGLLAAYCLENDTTPSVVYQDDQQLQAFQTFLVEEGIEIEWPQDFYKEREQIEYQHNYVQSESYRG